jgi:signal transduction histidine kinase
MKPRSTWIITAICLALLCGAMAWTTRSMLRMERQQDRMAADAAVQENARLALWRMESIASALVIAESARPPEHYRTFTTPEVLLDNKTFNAWNNDVVVALSPLVREPPDTIRLHFEMDADGNIRSPQVPQGQDLAACENIQMPPAPVLAQNSDNFSLLCTSLNQDTPAGNIKAMRDKLRVPAQLKGNRALLWSVNSVQLPESDSTPPPAPAPTPPAVKEEPAPAAISQSAAATRMTQIPPAYALQQRAMKPEDAQAQQLEMNTMEQKARQDFVNSEVSKVSRRATNYEDTSLKKLSTLPVESNARNFAKLAPADENGLQPTAAQAPAAPASAAQRPLQEAAAVQELLPSPVPVQPPDSAAPAGPPASSSVVYDITDFRPLWLEDSLLLTRRVSTPERQWIQGAWLDWEKLRTELLAAVQDRFPKATVVRAPDNRDPGAHLLASLPVMLIPGAVKIAAPAFWSPLKVSLGIAWICVLLAVAAVALVLRGMMALSERRASFVSSVTHELRTPLATFKLYSEMLADGMVKEESKKQQYLETLTGEADRLGHLVENVLAYSRIERGKGPCAAASLTAGDLVKRIEPRLNQRALLAGMDFALTADPAALETPLRTDAGAVEQILCNLVDNACKYGRRDSAPGKVELAVNRERRRLCLTVRDHGPGIPRSEQNTIFLPFHKSARDAAHSAPGVGLGLALCRRLAGELRGTLELDRSWTPGTAFVLRLPA